MTVGPKTVSLFREIYRCGFRRDTLEKIAPGLRLRLQSVGPCDSGSRGREAGASRIFILSPGGAPPMENSYGARWCGLRNSETGLAGPIGQDAWSVEVFTQTRRGLGATLNSLSAAARTLH